MRTINLIRALLALMLVLATTIAIPASALAHQHHPVKHAPVHHRRHHRHHRHHRRHVKRHTKLAPSSTTAAPAPTAFGATASQSFPPATITGISYYVSPTGSDSNSGTTTSQPWKTVGRANRANLRPGDGVLFQGGATYNDDTLMPGWGSPMSGTSSAPIVFASYGPAKATLTKGIWLNGNSNLVFENLNLGPTEGVTGTGNDITVEGCSIGGMLPGVVPAGYAEEAIDAMGSNWLIRDNTIDHTGDSGMLLRGDHFVVRDNKITNTGLDPKITWGDHGIYLKASDSSVIGNTISNYHNDGVSVRYRNSIVSNNTIANGEIGIAWFQYDPTAGKSNWAGNNIVNDSVAGIYVSPTDVAGATRESFVITQNRIGKPTDPNAAQELAAGWESMNLKPTSGTYSVTDNSVG